MAELSDDTHAAWAAPLGLHVNGDLPLSREQARAYVDHHRARNAELARRSRKVRTTGYSPRRVRSESLSSPSRVAMMDFLAWALLRHRPRFGGGAVTVLDIGCGSGEYLPLLEQAGYQGTYVGLDVARHARWSDEATARFERRLILGSALRMAPEELPEADLVISSTALEHIRDDAEAVRRVGSRVRPGGVEIHLAPACDALRLYGPHGWRQYSPWCVRELFPGCEVHRIGGWFSSMAHLAFITRPAARGRDPRAAHPRLYRMIRSAALRGDALVGHRPATILGVVAVHPGPGDARALDAPMKSGRARAA